MLKYLARYTHRVAISNRRLIALEDGEVKFHWKDYAHGGGQKTMTLKATEFIRRFLLHVLPSGFVRIRHYGFLANRVCRERLALCRALLGVETTPEPAASGSSVSVWIVDMRDQNCRGSTWEITPPTSTTMTTAATRRFERTR